MKKLLLCALLTVAPVSALSVEDFLGKLHIEDQRQAFYLSYLCNLVEKLSLEDRTVIAVFLDQLEEEHDSSASQEECEDMCCTQKSE